MPVVIYNLSHYLFRHNDRIGHTFVVTVLFIIAAAIQAGTVASLLSLETARAVESALLLLLPSSFDTHHALSYYPYQERTYVTIANWFKAGCIWLLYLGARQAIRLIRQKHDALGIIVMAATFVAVSQLGHLPIA